MESLWRKQTGRIKPNPEIEQERIKVAHWDVIVVGAGMAGILTAYFLQKQGKRVLITEAEEIASGQTGRTTAKITSQHGLKYAKLIKEIGEEKAKLYAQANEQAIAQYARLVKELNISCQFERTDACLYTTTQREVLEEEAKAAEHLGIAAEFTTETELPFTVNGAVSFYEQAQFSPLEFIKRVSQELHILEHTRVTEIKDHWVITDKGILTADDIVVTSHYPVRDVPGFYFLRQHQERSYVLALEGAEPIRNMYYGIDADGLSFRQAGNYLLLGGSGHRTGYSYGKKGKTKGMCQGAYEHLLEEARKYYPTATVAARWSAQDCMPHDGIPFIGRYSVFTPHLYVATGFQKWGMSTAMVAAKVLCDEICGRENPYEALFSPMRLLIRAGSRDFIKDASVSAVNLTKGLFGKRRCTHLGCALSWNEETKSWDCPCHGSRFDAEGKVLDNPAVKELR